MTKREVHITNILRSKGISVIISLLGVWMAWSALMAGKVAGWAADTSVAFPTPSTWFEWAPELSFWVNIAVIIAVAGVMISLNRHYNLLRTLSLTFVAIFIFTTCATPAVAGAFGGSTLLALAVMVCVWIMFSIYSLRVCSRRVFLVFTILSAGAMVDYTFLLYVPVFLIGMGQMKVFKLKKLAAALLGLITPPWIVYGLGLLPLPQLPVVYFTPPQTVMDIPGGLPLLATVAATMLAGIVVGMINLFRIMGFNSRARAYNGLLSVISILTGVFAVVNFTNLVFYVTLLNACVAFQVGLFFRYALQRRGYILILSLLAIYTGLWFWQLTAV